MKIFSYKVICSRYLASSVYNPEVRRPSISFYRTHIMPIFTMGKYFLKNVE